MVKISVDKDREILLEEVYNGIGLKTRDNEFMGICMRDSGFEFNYEGKWYEAKKGIIKEMKPPKVELKKKADLKRDERP